MVSPLNKYYTKTASEISVRLLLWRVKCLRLLLGGGGNSNSVAYQWKVVAVSHCSSLYRTVQSCWHQRFQSHKCPKHRSLFPCMTSFPLHLARSKQHLFSQQSMWTVCHTQPEMKQLHPFHIGTAYICRGEDISPPPKKKQFYNVQYLHLFT